MLLTITSRGAGADKISYLAAKHPGKVQTFEVSAVCKAHIFFPEYDPESCTLALLIDADTVQLTRGAIADEYVSDRAYTVGSLFSVAVNRTLRSALNGDCKDEPDLPKVPHNLTVELVSVPRARNGDELIRNFFEPLGYVVETIPHSLETDLDVLREPTHYTVRLTATKLLSEVLCHLYVLVPALAADTHHWIDEREVEKLLKRGETWLANHPYKIQITRRYLKRNIALATDALAQLEGLVTPVEPEEEETVGFRNGPDIGDDVAPLVAVDGQPRLPLSVQRHTAVIAALKDAQASTVLDVGCGGGQFVRKLVEDEWFTKIGAVDVSPIALGYVARRLKLNKMEPAARERIELFQGSMTYRDARFKGYDAISLVEVIEHIDPPRLHAVERVIFEYAKPKVVIVTTPNRRYNAVYEFIESGHMRHNDHRFEWDTAEFAAWADDICKRFGYKYDGVHGVGEVHEEYGQPTSIVVFTRD